MAQQLNSLVALLEDLGLTPSILKEAHNHLLSPAPGDHVFLFQKGAS